ncbi:MAG TPA: TolC family protein [Polyangiaceae bacterium]|jgi:outer membrane protein TolC|nr:TolC family protein [Polyangiaceae bacterium]
MSCGRTTVFAACLVGIASVASIARADATEVLNAAAASLPPSAPTHSRILSLKRCLELAALNYPKVQEARAKLDEKRAQLDQAYTSPYSDFTLTGGLGPAPSVHGTAVYTPDTDRALSDHMGLAWQLGVTGAIPLWTFGKITNLWDAADAQVKVGEHEIRKEQNEVKLNVRRAYYGVQLARDALALLRDAASRIDKYVGPLQKKVDDGDGDDIQLLRLKMYRAELDARESEAVRQEAIALSGLRYLAGDGPDVDVADEPLQQNSHRLGPLAHYLAAAQLYRPEVNMARAGVRAREAQMRLERAKFFPDLALGLSFAYSAAPLVEDQRNPFVRDGANYLSYGAALVFKYKLDFLPQSARLAQANAQLEEQRATERYALGGVGTEVEQAFREAEDAERRLDAYTRATSYAKQWLVQVQEGIDVGTFEDQDIVDPAKEYATKRFLQMNATFDYNIALAKLALATGWDVVTGDDE